MGVANMFLTKSAIIRINGVRRKRDKSVLTMSKTANFSFSETYLKGLRIKKRETKRERIRRVETLLNIGEEIQANAVAQITPVPIAEVLLKIQRKRFQITFDLVTDAGGGNNFNIKIRYFKVTFE